MARVAKLYSPEVLALATDLSAFRLDPGANVRGRARSPSCGSVLDLSLVLDRAGAVERVGIKAQACAIGQASAAIFAKGAVGRTGNDIAAALAGIENWLAGNGPMPEWPGLDAIAPASAFPGRHGAILLAWRAARDAFAGVTLPRT